MTETQPICPICLNVCKNTDHSQIPCGHIFHMACLKPWTDRKATCPVCRTDLRDDGAAPTTPPVPKFRRGQAVQYNAQKRTEFFQYIRDHPGSRMPTVPLRIWTDPRWCPGYRTWVYEYEYDWTSEGSALETDLELAHPQSGVGQSFH